MLVGLEGGKRDEAMVPSLKVAMKCTFEIIRNHLEVNTGMK